MRTATATRLPQLAVVACLPFLLLSVADGAWKPELVKGPLITFWAYDFFAWVVVPGLVLAALHRWSTIAPRDYGLTTPLGWKDIALVTPIPLSVVATANLVAHGIADIVLGHVQPAFSYITALKALGDLWILGTIYLAATAGFWESIFYIGLPWMFVSQTWRPTPSVKLAFALGTAVLFALAHRENGPANMVGVFVFQLFAVRWYFKLGSLWPVIGAHALVDVYYFWPWPWIKI